MRTKKYLNAYFLVDINFSENGHFWKKIDFYEKLSKFIKNIILIYLVFLMGFTIKNIGIYIPHVKWFLRQKSQYWKKKILKNKTLTPYLPPTFCRIFLSRSCYFYRKIYTLQNPPKINFWVCVLVGKKTIEEGGRQKRHVFGFVFFYAKIKH